jgi:cytochrome P450
MDLPVVDPKEIPLIVHGDDDWRDRFDKLREAYPAFRVGDDPTIWFTRYDACREIFTNGDLFWAGNFGHEDTGVGLADCAWDAPSAEEGVQRHVAMRQTLMHIFAPNKAKEWEAAMLSVARNLIDRVADRGHCDFVHDFAHLYFPLIGCDMIGVPREDWDQLIQWEQDAFKIPADSDSKIVNLNNPTIHRIIEYVHKLLDEKRANPDDRLATWVAKQQDDGVFSAGDARWAMESLVLGSGHTVAAHLTYVFRYLADHPDIQAKVGADPDSVNGVCEELLRLYPIGGSQRTVTTDMEFHGVQLKAGDRVFVNFSMPNRDPRGPDFAEVNFERKVNKHLAFNQGWRQCIGLFFARKARNIAVTEWHKTIPSYELDRTKPIVEQVYAGVGFHELPLKWKPA